MVKDLGDKYESENYKKLPQIFVKIFNFQVFVKSI